MSVMRMREDRTLI